jgi:antitoxin MazE
MQVRLAKWGEDIGLRLPRPIVSRLGLTAGTRMNIEAAKDGRLMLTRAPRRYSLDDLLSGMTPDRQHDLQDDDPRGSEVI